MGQIPSVLLTVRQGELKLNRFVQLNLLLYVVFETLYCSTQKHTNTNPDTGHMY